MIDLFQPGAYARTAGGNLERPDLQVTVIKWITWSLNADNGGGGGTAVWDKARLRWQQAGILEFPWMHVRSMQDLQRLVSVGQAKNSPAIGLNIENVVGDNLDLKQVAAYLGANWKNPVHMATLDWVQNGQGWGALKFVHAALEFFPGEGNMKAGYNPAVAKQCFDHALSEGLEIVSPLFKTKDLSPAIYGDDYSICHSLYTADDIPPTQPGWDAWKSAGCHPYKGADMALTPNQKKEFRAQLVRFALVAEKYENQWHYTQARPYTGLGAPFSSTHHNDCSSYCALLFFSAGRAAGFGVHDPLDEHYSGYGNTQTAYEFLRDHKAPKDKYRVGDLAIYGPSYDTVHITMCRKAGTAASAVWSSFGQEAGPEDRQPLSYHPSPLLGVYRHPALL